MARPIIAALVFIVLTGSFPASGQQAATFKNFTSFKQPVPGIDFYASNRQNVTPYEKPAANAVAKLKSLLGENLPKGAIFICSTLQQKDSIYEPIVLKSGYGWTLTAVTPEVRAQEMIARIKSQMGGEIPAEILERIKNRPPEMMADAEKQMVTSTVQQIAYAVLQSMLAQDLQYRSSRVDDMGKSPLPDWLDIGIASYASGAYPGLPFLQQHMDQTFPIEDVLSMSRPFMASSSDQGGGSRGMNSGNGGARGGMNGGMGGGGFSGGPPAGFGGRSAGSLPAGGGGAMRGNAQRSMPKDEQDRMLFDGQSGTFFSYLLEKVGIEKMRELIRQAKEGKESREFVMQSDVLGPDFEKIEEGWATWVKALK
jgi:hypothetical protein